MARYHFHLLDRSGMLSDEEGVALDSLADVLRLALANARALMSEDVANGVLDLNGAIQVTDDQSRTLLILPFEDAVTLVSAKVASQFSTD
ncbi:MULTISPECIES: DUF6894 family protein [Sphingobium]|uniref:DUF6894 family protein n=1 Tax=Sphingobium sp. MI1205 TaxID=407020 RepID=UPI0007702AA7|nr:hypothetical protein [Sphingobium sp. MI1205]AMK20088.1 hypothetical protein K663_18636 [Sphingobium sp. MI1205]